MAEFDGDSGANDLIGGADDDILRGFGGNDTLTGGLGTDDHFGGKGADILIITDPAEATSGEGYYGGKGSDTLRLIHDGTSGFGADLRNAAIAGIERLEVISSGTALTTVLRVDAADFGGGIALDAAVSFAGGVNQNEQVNVRIDGAAALDLSGLTIEGAQNGILGDGFTVTGGGSVFDFTGSQTNDTVTGSGAGSTLDGGRGNDYLAHAGGTSVSLGGRGNDWIDSDGTSGRISGGKGNDRISFDYGVSPGAGAVVSGDLGDDLFELRADGSTDFDISAATISGFEALTIDQRRPGPEIDYALTLTAAQLAEGFSGTATITVASGRAMFVVDMGDVEILDMSQLVFVGSDFSTDVTGAGGVQQITGGDIADVFSGGAGKDTLTGNGGADDLTGGDGHDLLKGGDGEDLLTGGEGIDRLYGGDKADVLSGGIGTDDLIGGAGADSLRGGNGKDTLSGGNGSDTLSGDGGQDQLSGGNGVDYFRYTDQGDSGAGSTARDTITDLSASDHIVFDTFDGDATTAGIQELTFIGNTALSGEVGELRIKATSDGSGMRLLADTDGDGAADFEILLEGVTSFDATLDLIY